MLVQPGKDLPTPGKTYLAMAYLAQCHAAKKFTKPLI